MRHPMVWHMFFFRKFHESCLPQHWASCLRGLLFSCLWHYLQSVFSWRVCSICQQCFTSDNVVSSISVFYSRPIVPTVRLHVVPIH